jgi:carbonic anhydrase
LRHVQDVRHKHEARLALLENAVLRADRLGELNVIEQVTNVCNTSVVRAAWERGQALAVHGWIYGLQDGLVHDLGVTAGGEQEVAVGYGAALDRLV